MWNRAGYGIVIDICGTVRVMAELGQLWDSHRYMWNRASYVMVIDICGTVRVMG